MRLTVVGTDGSNLVWKRASGNVATGQTAAPRTIASLVQSGASARSVCFFVEMTKSYWSCSPRPL